jgi:hypothetical protein
MITPEEFEKLPTVERLLEAEDYLRASNIAYAMGNTQKNNELRKYSAELAKRVKRG